MCITSISAHLNPSVRNEAYNLFPGAATKSGQSCSPASHSAERSMVPKGDLMEGVITRTPDDQSWQDQIGRKVGQRRSHLLACEDLGWGAEEPAVRLTVIQGTSAFVYTGVKVVNIPGLHRALQKPNSLTLIDSGRLPVLADQGITGLWSPYN